MKWPRRKGDYIELRDKLTIYNANKKLSGLVSDAALDTFVTQIIASQRREDYYRLVQNKEIGPDRANPNHSLFDPERAVAHHLQSGRMDEACWLMFLMTHFARHAKSEWRRLSDVYGMLGEGTLSWKKFARNPAKYIQWLEQNWEKVGGAFGNHRKYESLNPEKNRSTNKVLLAYYELIGKDHANYFDSLQLGTVNDPFDVLYRNFKVLTFGRLAKFDFLMLLARYGVLEITPRSAYLATATGPKKGAKLLFANDQDANITNAALQGKLDDLDEVLAIGMEVLEDAICNWQKSPEKFIHFTG